MTATRACQLITFDVGNSAAKIARFRLCCPPDSAGAKPDLQLDGVTVTVVDGVQLRGLPRGGTAAGLEAFLDGLPEASQHWYGVSVNHVSQESFAAWILQRRPQDQYLVLNHAHFPLEIDVRYPERVGTDRLAAAVAANLGRSPDRGIIVIDAGTAITVDLLTPDGVFRGGAILPGLETAAAALAAATDALPHVELRGPSAAPSAIGKSTADAILSGLVWGCVGAVRELIARISEEAGLDPELCCTGGAGRLLAQLLGPQCLYDPQLVLRGIALTGWQLGSVPDD